MLKQRIKQTMLQYVAIAITYLSVTADCNVTVLHCVIRERSGNNALICNRASEVKRH